MSYLCFCVNESEQQILNSITPNELAWNLTIFRCKVDWVGKQKGESKQKLNPASCNVCFVKMNMFLRKKSANLGEKLQFFILYWNLRLEIDS